MPIIVVTVERDGVGRDAAPRVLIANRDWSEATMATERRCAKCGGKMFFSEDVYSGYLHCLQCGSTREMRPLGALDEELEATLRPLRQAMGLAPERSLIR